MACKISNKQITQIKWLTMFSRPLRKNTYISTVNVGTLNGYMP